MLKQPKGLIAAALANTGERFGFYTMMAILTLFLMSKFGIDGEQAGKIYSFFYTSIYILALVGGLIADRLRNYKGTIIAGILVMTAGYAALMVPTVTSKTVVIGALMLIAFGNGLFKGNLQALVGQLYDNEQYAKLRDTGFQIFYMFINIGAMFAPFAAVGVRNWWLRTQGFLYNSDLSALCHQYIGGTMSPEVAQGRFSELAAEVSLGGVPADMGVFAQSYLNAFNTGFHYAFGVAIVALVFSLVVFLANKKKLPDPKVAAASRTTPSKAEIQQDAREIKQRLYALFAVFAIVLFFWFSFHQNGLTLTLFAQDYTRLEIFGMPITAEIFQSANPFCVVVPHAGHHRRVRLAAQPRQGAFDPDEDRDRNGHRRIRLRADGLRVAGPSQTRRSAGAGRSLVRRARHAVAAGGHLPDPDHRRTVHLAAGPVVRVEGRSAETPGPDAGLLAGCHGAGQRPAVHRPDPLQAHLDLRDVEHLRHRLRHLDVRHAGHGQMARTGHEIDGAFPFWTKPPQNFCGGFFAPVCAGMLVMRTAAA